MDYLKAHKGQFKRDFGVNELFLFGSFSRNEQTEKSDIDLLMETDRKNFRNRLAFKTYLENHFQRPVDVGYLDSINSYIRQKIQEELIHV